jgi:hypothetical protein
VGIGDDADLEQVFPVEFLRDFQRIPPRCIRMGQKRREGRTGRNERASPHQKPPKVFIFCILAFNRLNSQEKPEFDTFTPTAHFSVGKFNL